MAGKPNKHEWYIEKLQEAWGDEFVCLEEYQGVKKSIEHLHIPCGRVKVLRPDQLLGKGKNRRGCRQCNNVRRTHEQFVEEIRAIHGDSIEIVGKYTVAHNTIEIIHRKCGQVRKPYAGNLLQGYSGCRECGLKELWAKNTMTDEDYKNRVKSIHGDDVIPLEEYKGVRVYTKHFHISCGRTWTTQAGNVLNGHSCDKCAREAKRLTDEEYRERLYKIYQSEIQWISGSYETYKSILTFKNNNCNHVFEKNAGDMVNTARMMVNNCPRCSSSKGEVRIGKFLNSINVKYKAEYIFADCRNIYPLPFDFAVLKDNDDIEMIIEFDGQEHFEPIEYFGGDEKFKQRIKNDQMKNEYCKVNNIKLIRIPYWECDKIESILEKELEM
ncbi:hypothetical protein COI61_03820 [Bacillus cereus]|nr:hypothetical protein COI61_03820 [Bacillus cereus]